MDPTAPKTVALTVNVPISDLSPDAIREAVINAAVREVLGIRVVVNIGEDGDESFTETNDTLRAFRARVQAQVETSAKDIVAANGAAFVNDILSREFQPMTSWGETKGKPQTIRSMVGEFAVAWLHEKVDQNGRNDGYGDKSSHRVHWLIRQEVERAFKEELRAAVNEVSAEIKPTIAKTFTAAVAETVNRLLGVSK